MRRWQLREHLSYLRNTLPYSTRCHETMATDGESFILEGYFTMLWPLSWDDDNWQSRFHTLWMYNHAMSVVMTEHVSCMRDYLALTVVIRRWQLTEQVSYTRDILPCSDRCHETITTEGACFIPEGNLTMLWPLSWDDGNWRSMFHTLGMNNQALAVYMRPWKLREHISYLRNTLPCSDRCHETMPTDGACFILEGYFTMLWPLSWDDDNWRSIFHTLEMNNHALTVVMRRW